MYTGIDPTLPLSKSNLLLNRDLPWKSSQFGTLRPTIEDLNPRLIWGHHGAIVRFLVGSGTNSR